MKTNNTRDVFCKKKAFTLVELIIVITILAILATIAFVSFHGYSAQSRDANRLATVKNISTGLDVFYTKTGVLPPPDTIEFTGTFSGFTLGKVGTIGENITRQVVLNEVPKDPLTSGKYMYGVDINKRKFQIGYLLERGNVYIPGFSSLYANDGEKAKVLGTYTYPYKLNNMVYSLPSLIYTGTGELNIAKFIVNGGDNVPGGDNNQSIGDSLELITGVKNLTLTGIDIPTITLSEFKNASGIPKDFEGISSALGISKKDTLGELIFGDKYFSTPSTTSNLKWRDLDSNCDLRDIEIINNQGLIIQTWAGCNSMVGNGREWGDTGNGICSNYLQVVTTTDCLNASVMGSNKKEKAWSVATSVSGTSNNLWGKIYTWTGALTACGSGRHLPSDDEYVQLENFFWKERLGNTEGCRYSNTGASGDEWKCDGLGYSGASLKTKYNNLSNILNIPLAGYLKPDGSGVYAARGGNEYLWTSTINSLGTYAYIRDFNILHSEIGRRYLHIAHGFSVRCIKDK